MSGNQTQSERLLSLKATSVKQQLVLVSLQLRDSLRRINTQPTLNIYTFTLLRAALSNNIKQLAAKCGYFPRKSLPHFTPKLIQHKKELSPATAVPVLYLSSSILLIIMVLWH